MPPVTPIADRFLCRASASALADVWDDWCMAAAEATLTLARWRDAEVDDRPQAYAAYRAALAWESITADMLGESVAQQRGERPAALAA
jgi:hypothetical protein